MFLDVQSTFTYASLLAVFGLQAREKQGGKGIFVADGYNSDDEVYATEEALERAAGHGKEEDIQQKQQIGALAPLDHEKIDYQPFAKDFYTAVPKIAGLSSAQV